jgi:hypothetical protein
VKGACARSREESSSWRLHKIEFTRTTHVGNRPSGNVALESKRGLGMVLGHVDFRRLMPFTYRFGGSGDYRHVVLFSKRGLCETGSRRSCAGRAEIPLLCYYFGRLGLGYVGPFRNYKSSLLENTMLSVVLLLNPTQSRVSTQQISDQPWRYSGRSCCGATVIHMLGVDPLTDEQLSLLFKRLVGGQTTAAKSRELLWLSVLSRFEAY